MNEFNRFHPMVNIVYFASVIVISAVFMHPIFIAEALFGSILYSSILIGKKQLKFIVSAVVPFFILSILINSFFNHEGATILTYFKSGNPLTFESLVYAAFSAAMLAAVVFWFSAFNKIVTSDKLMYLFGKISPSAALVFSMTLRFVPKMNEDFRQIRNSQKSLGIYENGLFSKVKGGAAALSALVSMMLETSVQTSDSMKARGFGTAKRTVYTAFRFEFRDKLTLGINIGLDFYIIGGILSGAMKYTYFPIFSVSGASLYGISVFAAFFALCLLPSIIEFKEAARWAALKQKI